MNEIAHIEIDGHLIAATADERHEWTMPTELVALGYGVSESVIRDHKTNHADELVEGKHWDAVEVIDSIGRRQKQTIWTKRGVIRLGFFIRSKRAKLFRDRAEDLIIAHESAQPVMQSFMEDYKRLVQENTALRMENEALREFLPLNRPGDISGKTGSEKWRKRRGAFFSRKGDKRNPGRLNPIVIQLSFQDFFPAFLRGRQGGK